MTTNKIIQFFSSSIFTFQKLVFFNKLNCKKSLNGPNIKLYAKHGKNHQCTCYSFLFIHKNVTFFSLFLTWNHPGSSGLQSLPEQFLALHCNKQVIFTKQGFHTALNSFKCIQQTRCSRCHMSCIICHMSRVNCNVSHSIFFISQWSLMVEVLFLKGPTPSGC